MQDPDQVQFELLLQVGGQDGLELDADAHRSRLLREEAEGSLEAGDGPLVLRRHRHFRRRRALSLALSLSEVEPSRSLSLRYFVCDVTFLFWVWSYLIVATRNSLSWNARKVSNAGRGLVERGGAQISELARASGVGFGPPRED